jgi:hypothetical protein
VNNNTSDSAKKMPPNAKSSQLNSSSSLSATKKPQQNKAPLQPPKPILTYEQMLKLADNVQKDKTKPTVSDAIAPKPPKSMPPPPPPPQVEPKKAINTQVKTTNTAQKPKPKAPPPTNIQPQSKTNGTNINNSSNQPQNKVTIDKEKQQPQSSSSTAASSNLCRLTPEQIAKLKQRAAPPVPGARPQSSMVNNGLNNKIPNRTSASDLNNFRNGTTIPEKSKLAKSNSFNDVQSKNVNKNGVNRSNGLLDKQQTGSKSSGVSAWDRITSDVKKSTVKNSNFFDFLKI